MHKRKKGKKLGRVASQRTALLKNLAGALIMNEHITTTQTHAKVLRPYIEKLITHARRHNLHGLRLILKKLPEEAAMKVYNEISTRYAERNGGYTRIIKVMRRNSDGARMARIEFVQ